MLLPAAPPCVTASVAAHPRTHARTRARTRMHAPDTARKRTQFLLLALGASTIAPCTSCPTVAAAATTAGSPAAADAVTGERRRTWLLILQPTGSE